jgi:ligand-binding SRPBCC domain-containing protein
MNPYCHPQDSVALMITIRWTTWVNAPMERCFRLATSAEFHSAAGASAAVQGTNPDGLQVGDTLLWQAWRCGLHLSHTSRIDQLRPFTYYREIMVEGGFRKYDHEHHFAPMDDGTRMRDEVHFVSPMGPLGVVLEHVLLRKYVTRLLVDRHSRLKRAAESDEWRKYLHEEQESTVVEPRPKITKMQRFA